MSQNCPADGSYPLAHQQDDDEFEALHFELEPIGIKVKIVEPGVIETDFGGRSFDFNNDESMEENQESLERLMNFQKGFLAGASKPIVVAEQIHRWNEQNTV